MSKHWTRLDNRWPKNISSILVYDHGDLILATMVKNKIYIHDDLTEELVLWNGQDSEDIYWIGEPDDPFVKNHRWKDINRQTPVKGQKLLIWLSGEVRLGVMGEEFVTTRIRGKDVVINNPKESNFNYWMPEPKPPSSVISYLYSKGTLKI